MATLVQQCLNLLLVNLALVLQDSYSSKIEKKQKANNIKPISTQVVLNHIVNKTAIEHLLPTIASVYPD